MLSAIVSIAYVHGFAKAETSFCGQLPPYPDVQKREHLFVVLGEVHNQLDRKPSPSPDWLTIPEKGLYTGIAVFGSIGSGKTLAPGFRHAAVVVYLDNASFLSRGTRLTHSE